MPRSNSVCTTARRPAWRGLTGLVATFGLAAFVAACGGSETPASPASPESISVAERYDWYSFGGDHTERHFAPLDQINTETISQLKPVWYQDIYTAPGAFSAPLEVDGVVYFAAGYSVVHAMDAMTGELLWQYDPEAPQVAGEKLRSSWGIRGIGYGDGKVLTGTVDGRLIALDAETGDLLWSAMTIEPEDGRYITGAPLVYGNTVIIGHGGGDFAAVRGYVTAYDLQTGEQLWRFYTVPGNPADGFEDDAMEMAAETWTGEWWKYGGGGTVWNTMTYDKELNLVYLGTGNGAPWNQKIRSPGGGDNLFLCAIVALNADTGEYVWHYQVNPAETWDFNAAMDMQLADLEIDGETRKVILHAPKNGFFYVIDRETGRVISAEPFVDNVTWADRIDLETGRPVENPEARFPDGQAVLVFPSPTGAHTAEPMAFNPDAGLVYINAIERGKVYVDPVEGVEDWEFTPGQIINNGVGPAPASIEVPPITNELLAWDPVRQSEAWSVPLVGNKNGGLLTTAGNLVFQGGVEGKVRAYNAETGEQVWEYNVQNGVTAAPISFEVDGTQYLTIIAGWRASTADGPGLSWDYRLQQRRVITFALGGGVSLPEPDLVEMPFLDDPDFEVDPELAASGAAVFGQHCAICHGGGLNAGGAAPDLRKAGTPLTFEGISMVVQDGALVPNGMPQFGEFSDEQVAALQHYIRREARAALAAETQD